MSETKQENSKKTQNQSSANKTLEKKTAQKKPQPQKAPDATIMALDELNLKVVNAQNQELINESGNTVVCLLMQSDGRVLTSFMGDYNKEILTTLDKVLRKYFKGVKKHLLSENFRQNTPPTKTNLKENKENNN